MFADGWNAVKAYSVGTILLAITAACFQSSAGAAEKDYWVLIRTPSVKFAAGTTTPSLPESQFGQNEWRLVFGAGTTFPSNPVAFIYGRDGASVSYSIQPLAQGGSEIVIDWTSCVVGRNPCGGRMSVGVEVQANGPGGPLHSSYNKSF